MAHFLEAHHLLVVLHPLFHAFHIPHNVVDGDDGRIPLCSRRVRFFIPRHEDPVVILPFNQGMDRVSVCTDHRFFQLPICIFQCFRRHDFNGPSLHRTIESLFNIIHHKGDILDPIPMLPDEFRYTTAFVKAPRHNKSYFILLKDIRDGIAVTCFKSGICDCFESKRCTKEMGRLLGIPCEIFKIIDIPYREDFFGLHWLLIHLFHNDSSDFVFF